MPDIKHAFLFSYQFYLNVYISLFLLNMYSLILPSIRTQFLKIYFFKEVTLYNSNLLISIGYGHGKAGVILLGRQNGILSTLHVFCDNIKSWAGSNYTQSLAILGSRLMVK